ncbi:serine hydrolase domain-containing protein [Pseudomonas sp. Z3-8]|uniref:serine hydrolase domain-containing protein n=1 Tax=Pseudomonas sp. Z3-8 TaxID=2817412 RepID=UPI003DAA3FEE
MHSSAIFGVAAAGRPLLLSLGLLAAGITAGAWAEDYPHAQEPIGTVEQIYDGAMLPDLAVSTYRNIDRLFPTHRIKAGDHPYALPKSDKQLPNVRFTVGDKKYDLYDFVALDSITAMLVLKDGKIVFETYQRGNTEKTRWMSMSIAKSVTSTLAAAAIKDGLIKSLDAQVVDYVPALKGSAYEGVTVRNVLMMSSGVKWNETYTDPASDRRALLKAQISQKPHSAMALMASLPRAAEPGTANTYSTGETQVLGEIVRGAVKMPLADYLSQKIWQPFGMESDARWWLDSPDGVEIGGSGISATLRDYGRFGLFFMNGGKINGTSILPEGWVKEATLPTTLKGGKSLDYGYMWWTAWTEPSVKDGAYSAVGIQGQNIYVNPANNVVIVTFGAQPKPVDKEPIDPMVFFDAVVAALK